MKVNLEQSKGKAAVDATAKPNQNLDALERLIEIMVGIVVK